MSATAPTAAVEARTVPLHGKKAAGRVALVDEADFDLVGRYRWYIREDVRPNGSIDGPYARTNIKRPGQRGPGRQAKVTMHQVITGWPLTDHINHDGLDNRRANLRPASNRQNSHNRRPQAGKPSPKGVKQGSANSWQARIRINGTLVHLGTFSTPQAAADAYDSAARAAFGDFACLNLPEARAGEQPCFVADGLDAAAGGA